MQIRVPVDDTHTNVMFYTVHAPEAELPADPPCIDYEYEVSTTGRTSSTTSRARTSWPG